MYRKQQGPLLLARNLTLALLALTLSACESTGNSENLVTNAPLRANQESASVQGTANAAFTAALSPLEDLGIRKRQIPDLLKQLEDDPYATPTPMACDSMKKEMADIDALLGPDVDRPQAALSAADNYAEQGGEMAQDAVVGFVQSQTSIIPLRSVVRRITGASKHDKEVARAIQAGKLRRAYLRGLAEAKFGSSCLATRRIIASTTPPQVVASNDAPDAAENLEVTKK